MVIRLKNVTCSTFDASVCILCIDKLLKEFERFEYCKCIKFTVSFFTNPFQERAVRELTYFFCVQGKCE
jgi:hypothetical protein